MKKKFIAVKRFIAVLTVLTMTLCCTGCGEELIPLTDAEREQIVYYSAHIISEFNRSQTEGYMALSKSQLEAIYSEEEETVSSQEQDVQEESSQTGTGQTQEKSESETVETTTLTKALGIKGITARCTGYKVQKDYVQDGVFAMTASEGNSYVVLTVKLKNTTKSGVLCDVLGMKKNFALCVNGDSYEVLPTFLPNDLGSFYGTVGGGKSKKTVLLFEVPDNVANDISGLSLEVDNGTTKQTILIN